MPSSETLYRQMAGEGATYIGLLLVVYDTLAEDFRRAGQAVERGDISARCEATNHALLLLGHLESWTESLDDATLASSLLQFYGYLRSHALQLQTATDPAAFHELARLVGETRACWQKRESEAPPAPAVQSTSSPAQGWDYEEIGGGHHSWSA